jgi:D-alanine-D-alanine ligase
VIAEQFIDGPEFTVGILDDAALPLVRIEAPQGNYDYQHKYFGNETKYHCPCGLPPAQERAIQGQALTAFRLLGCSGWGRLDLMLDKGGTTYFLEMNTIPGMTDHSLVPMAARASGISFEDLVVRILESAHVG